MSGEKRRSYLCKSRFKISDRDCAEKWGDEWRATGEEVGCGGGLSLTYEKICYHAFHRAERWRCCLYGKHNIKMTDRLKGQLADDAEPMNAIVTEVRGWGYDEVDHNGEVIVVEDEDSDEDEDKSKKPLLRVELGIQIRDTRFVVTDAAADAGFLRSTRKALASCLSISYYRVLIKDIDEINERLMTINMTITGKKDAGLWDRLNTLARYPKETCDPEYLPTSGNPTPCRQTLKEYCETGNNLVSKPICKEFCDMETDTLNRTTCDKAKIRYCEGHPSDPNCRCLLDSDGNNVRLIKQQIDPNIQGNYACWYEPCGVPNAILTTRIRNTKVNCRNINCVIAGVNIDVDDEGELGTLEIGNGCKGGGGEEIESEEETEQYDLGEVHRGDEVVWGVWIDRKITNLVRIFVIMVLMILVFGVMRIWLA